MTSDVPTLPMTATASASSTIILFPSDTGPHQQSPSIQPPEDLPFTEHPCHSRVSNSSSRARRSALSTQSAIKDIPAHFSLVCATKTAGALLTGATFIITVLGLAYFSYRQDCMARWTAAKDFYVECQALWVSYIFLSVCEPDQLTFPKSSNQSDPSCTMLIGTRLSPPPYISSDSYLEGVKRALHPVKEAACSLTHYVIRSTTQSDFSQTFCAPLMLCLICFVFSFGGLCLLVLHRARSKRCRTSWEVDIGQRTLAKSTASIASVMSTTFAGPSEDLDVEATSATHKLYNQAVVE